MPQLLAELPIEEIEIKNEKTDNNNLSFPYNITSIDPKLNAQLLEDFHGEKTGFVQVGPQKWFFPSGYVREAANIYNFQLRKDDVFVVTFPRSGTTWTQEMVWLLCNDLDYETAAKVPLVSRFTFIEYSCFFHKDVKAAFLEENRMDPENYKIADELDYPGWKSLTETKSRRFIKTHLPFSLLPPNLTTAGCKIVYVARNPKDVAVSYYHLNRTMRTQGYQGDFAKYWQYFKNNLQNWAPYWEHIKEGWRMRHDENVHFIFYENLNKNLMENMKELAHFLGKSYSNDQLSTLEEHLKIENFRNNKSVNCDILKKIGVALKTEECFIRKGKTGGWKDYFTPEMEQEANEWIASNLKDTDLKFPNCLSD